MKRKLLILLCFVMIAAFTFASCDLINNSGTTPDDPSSTVTPGTSNSDGDSCEHTFSDEWVYNSTQHWHVATCEHPGIKDALGSHVDEEQDGYCDVCNYKVGHSHTYEESWTTDAISHWHAATCKHTDVKGSLAAHIDENADGKCDVCGGDVELNIDDDDYALIIDAIYAARGGVASGKVESSTRVESLANGYIIETSAIFNYIFGSSSAYFKTETTTYNNEGGETTTSSTLEKWQELLGGDNVFGVYKEDDNDIAMDGAATTETMKGYLFSVSTLAGEYGVENILYTLYTLSTDSSASDLAWSKDEDTGVYTFSFNYLQINRDVAKDEAPNVNYYELTISFAHNANYILTSLDIVCDCYTNSIEDEIDQDYTYDDTTGTITMKPEGQYVADVYTFKVTQVAGERTYENENPRSKFIPDTFELFTDKTLSTIAPNTLNATVDKSFNIYLGNFLPEGTSITFDPYAFKATVEIDGVVYESADGVGFSNEVIYFAHTTLGSAPDVTCKIKKTGTYTLTVSIDTEHVKSVDVIVTESSSGGNNNPSTYDTTIDVEVADVYQNGTVQDWSVVANNPDYTVSFTATKTGYYTFAIPMGLAAYDKEAYDNTFSSSSPIDPYVPLKEWNPVAGFFTVFITEGDTYEFYVATYTASTYTIAISYSEDFPQ